MVLCILAIIKLFVIISKYGRDDAPHRPIIYYTEHTLHYHTIQLPFHNVNKLSRFIKNRETYSSRFPNIILSPKTKSIFYICCLLSKSGTWFHIIYTVVQLLPFSLSLSLSLYLSLSLSTYLSIWLSLSIYLAFPSFSVSLSFSFSIYLSLSIDFSSTLVRYYY